MKSQTKKLISNLKKEIDKRKKRYSWNKKGMTSLEKSQFRKEIKGKQAQLQFAEKLIDAFKKDITKNKPCPNEHPILAGCYEQVIEEINKTLNSALEK